jgi:hypothetical protein
VHCINRYRAGGAAAMGRPPPASGREFVRREIRTTYLPGSVSERIFWMAVVAFFACVSSHEGLRAHARSPRRHHAIAMAKQDGTRRGLRTRTSRQRAQKMQTRVWPGAEVTVRKARAARSGPGRAFFPSERQWAFDQQPSQGQAMRILSWASPFGYLTNMISNHRPSPSPLRPAERPLPLPP